MGVYVNKIKDLVRTSAEEIKLVFPEGKNTNIQAAALEIVKESKIVPILLFDHNEEIPKKRHPKIKYLALDKIVLTNYAQKLYQLRKHKGLTEEQALKLIQNRNYFATMMIKDRKADGEICGIEYTTADTLRPALQIVKTDPSYSLVTSTFILEKDQETYLFGDCAINLNPNAQQLADIAKAIGQFAEKTLQFKNIDVALLSYSTNGSGKGESVEKVQAALQHLDNEKSSKVNYVGELQFDAAFVEKVRLHKAPSLTWNERPNVYIFPNLDAGNIGYKIAQRMGGYEAIGPVLVGLAAPINDLSRGASTKDVVQLAYLTAAQALAKK